jgi:ketosteroid isomerase-like protein
MSETNKEIVEKANAYLAEGKTEEFLLLLAEDIVWTLLAETPTTIKGRKGIGEFMASTSGDGSQPPKFTVNELVAERDFVVANGDMTMTTKAGEIVPYAYCDIYRFQDGEIVELRTFINKTQAEKARDSSAAA